MYKHAKGFRGNKPNAPKPTKFKMGGGPGKKKGLVQRALEKWEREKYERDKLAKRGPDHYSRQDPGINDE